MPTAKNNSNDLPIKLFKNQNIWETWLAKNFGTSAGLWLRLSKKSSKIKCISYQEALDIALCYGWIDGQKKKFDEDTWIQRFTVRGSKSIWSKINRAKALDLIKQGRMQSAGINAIEMAKKNVRWDAAYDSHRTAEPPAELLNAFKEHPAAKEFFETLNSQNKYAILFRIQTAQSPSTREKRIAKFISMLEKHEKLYP